MNWIQIGAGIVAACLAVFLYFYHKETVRLGKEQAKQQPKEVKNDKKREF